MPDQLEFEQLEVKRGYWFYAGEVQKTVVVLRLTYDVYYELEKQSFFDLSNGEPHLNDAGFSYAIVWPEEGFKYPTSDIYLSDLCSVPPDGKSLSLQGAIDYAEWTVQQKIDWVT